MRPQTYVEAAHLARFLYEREYGVHVRKDEHDKSVAEARLAARYVASKRHIPIDPDYRPE